MFLGKQRCSHLLLYFPHTHPSRSFKSHLTCQEKSHLQSPDITTQSLFQLSKTRCSRALGTPLPAQLTNQPQANICFIPAKQKDSPRNKEQGCPTKQGASFRRCSPR